MQVIDLQLSSSNQYCVYLQPTGSQHHVTLQNNKFSGCYTGASIVDLTYSNSVELDNFTFDGNEVLNSPAAVTITAASGNTQTITGLTFTDNNIHDCTTGAPGVLSFVGAEASVMKFDGLTVTGNTFTDCKLGGTTATTHAVRFTWAIADRSYDDHKDRISNLNVSNNTFSNTNGAIYIEHTYGSGYGPNIISSNTATDTYANSVIALFYDNNITVSNNVINRVYPVSGDSYIDGMGFDIDFYNHAVLVENNTVTDTPGHASTAYSGQCIYWAYSVPPGIIRNNLCVNNKTAIHLEVNRDTLGGGATGGTYDPIYLYNNTVVNPTLNGIMFMFDSRAASKVWNNVVVGAVTAGSRGYCRSTYGAGASVVQNLVQNVFYGNTANYAVGAGADASPDCSGITGTATNTTEAPSDIYTNPYISAAGLITSTLSSAIDAGTDTTSLGGRTSDAQGNPVWGTTDIGAVEYQPPYTIGTDRMDKVGAIIYAGDQEGRFRTYSTATGTTCGIAITPANGTWADIGATDVRPKWGTVSGMECGNRNRTRFVFTPESAITSPVVIVTDAIPGRDYLVQIDGANAGSAITGTDCNASKCKADNNGAVTFSFAGSVSSAKTIQLLAQKARGGWKRIN
jgi:hypothetical protein